VADKITLSSPDITQREIDAVVGVLETQWLSLGPKVREFEEAFEQRLGVKHAIACNSGTSGLHMIWHSMGIGPGDEVITTPFSFIASSNSPIFEGATPVFVDIDPVTWQIDADLVESAITPQTKAVLPVDVFGATPDMDRINAIAAKYHWRVVEDSCEALGTKYKGRPAGTLGEAGVFGFYPNKQITTGEGGMVVTDDDEIATTCRSIRNQGRDEDAGWLAHARLGFNYRLPDINCAMGIVQMERLDEIIDRTEEMFVTRRAMRRVTIPVYSLLDHRVFDASLKKNYAGLDVEDLPHNFFAVSASLTTNDLHVHRHGPTWEAVRASAAIPGVLPPFITRSGDVLVDGGIVDNLPIAVMRDLKSGPNIVVSLRRQDRWRVQGSYESLPTRRGVLRDLLLVRWRKPTYPSLANVIVRGMSITSGRRLEETVEGRDLFVVPAGTEGVGFLEWEKAREVADAAYRYMAELLDRAGSLEALLKAGTQAASPAELTGTVARAN